MAKFDPPPKCTFKPPEWLEWIEEFGRFRTATKLHKEDGDVQRDSLLYAMGGREANRIFRTLVFTPPDTDTDYNTLVHKLTQYFIPKRNIIHERCIFQERVQTTSESVEEFVRDLNTLALHCDYTNTTEMVRDRFVMGIGDPLVKQKLQLMAADLSLDKAVTIARQNEQVKTQMREQLQHTAHVSEARAGGRYVRDRRRAEPQKSQTAKKNVIDVIVISGNTSNLLARDVAVNMGLVKRLDQIGSSKPASIGLMKTEPVTVKLTAGVEPSCLTTARRVPFPLMDDVKAELDRMVTSEVIRVVIEPTDWCSAMVPVVKKNGTVRICVDLKKLNIAVRREHLMLPSLDDIAPKLAHSKVFSTLDAASGFWQIPLDENSQLMTTFITPFGRYAFRRLPFGISSAPEIFQRKMSSLLEGLSGVEVIMDDILVHGRDLEEHDACLTAVIRRIDASGLKLNPSKCILRQSELRYFGHIITENGVKPDPARVKALVELSPPNNISELRTVLGMFQYLAKFAYNMSTVMKPMTDLLRAYVCWSWDHAQQSSFDETKRLLTTTPTLS